MNIPLDATDFDIALIEFEYVVADFRHEIASTIAILTQDKLITLLGRLRDAIRAVQISIDDMEARFSKGIT
jgi:hypothetical protein